MKRILGTLCLASLALGCATTSSVSKQLEPLGERTSALEQRQAATDAKLADLGTKLDAQLAELQALRKEVGDSSTVSSAAARQARDAVSEAQAAASRAELAAAKSTKAFELRQVKGSR